MIKCSKCNNYSDDGSQKCRFCGSPLYEGLPTNNGQTPSMPDIPQSNVVQNFRSAQATQIGNQTGMTSGISSEPVSTPQPTTPEPEKQKSPLKAILAIILIVAIAVGVVYFLGKDKPATNSSTNDNNNIINDKDSGYVYWTIEQGGWDTKYSNTEKPANAYSSYSSLNLSEPDQLIRTKMRGNSVESHETCLYYNNKIFCMGPNYWDTDGEITKNKLKENMESALGTSADNCKSYIDYSSCSFGGGTCYAHLDGLSVCDDGIYYCDITKDGSAICG